MIRRRQRTLVSALAAVTCAVVTSCSSGDTADSGTGKDSSSVTVDKSDSSLTEQLREARASEGENNEEGSLLQFYKDQGLTEMNACSSDVSLRNMGGGGERTWSNEGVVGLNAIPALPVAYESAASTNDLTVALSLLEQMDGTLVHQVGVKTSPDGLINWATDGMSRDSSKIALDESGAGASFTELTVPSVTGAEPDLVVDATWSC